MTSSGTRSLWAIITMTVVIGFVASLPGCASVGPVAPVVVSDVKSVAGTWQGVVYGPGSEPDYVEKKLAVGARNILLQHTWPGNVRELQNTLRRAAVWSDAATIQKADIEEALLTFPPAGQKLDAILAQPIDLGVDLKALMHKVASHYLEQAMKASGGNKTRAAELVGLPNYQTFSNWLSKYGRA